MNLSGLFDMQMVKIVLGVIVATFISDSLL